MKLQATHNDKAERLACGTLEAHRNKEYQTRSNPLKKETLTDLFSRIVLQGWNEKSQSRSVIEDLREELGHVQCAAVEELFGQIFDDLTGIHEDDVIGHFLAKPISWVTTIMVIPS